MMEAEMRHISSGDEDRSCRAIEKTLALSLNETANHCGVLSTRVT